MDREEERRQRWRGIQDARLLKEKGIKIPQDATEQERERLLNHLNEPSPQK